MSDEYHNNGQFKGSLVQESAKDALPTNDRNYPPSGDTTSEGGSNGDTLIRRAQRGFDNTKVHSQPDTYPSTTQGARTPDSFGASGLQATTQKSTDHPGFERSEPCASAYTNRKGETYESAAAGDVDATKT